MIFRCLPLDYPSDPRGRQAAEHGKQVEGEEARDAGEILIRDREVGIRFLNITVHSGENGERDKEDEEHVKELGKGLLEDRPIRWPRCHIDAQLLLLLHLFLFQHFVITIKFLEENADNISKLIHLNSTQIHHTFKGSAKYVSKHSRSTNRAVIK